MPKNEFRIPKFDYKSILRRTEEYCRRHNTDLTLSYALWLTGIDDAEYIYENSCCYFRSLREKCFSTVRFCRYVTVTERICKKYLYQISNDSCLDDEMQQNLMDYFNGFFSKLYDLKNTSRWSYDERIGYCLKFKGWIYE